MNYKINYCIVCGKEIIKRKNESIKRYNEKKMCSKECRNILNIKDLSGQKFGRLFVVERIGLNKQGNSTFLCKCDCGNEKIVRGASLLNGETQSCGCIRKERIKKYNEQTKKKYNTYDLTGEYGIGYTSKGEEFYFDIEDYELIKDYCWSMNDNYIIARNDDKIIQMHRLVTQCPDDMEVDHIYHNEWDNRKEFLRIITHSQNCMNNTLSCNNTSGVTGVSWDKNYEKWRAYIQIDKKNTSLGHYDDFNEAVAIRKAAELKYYGEYRYKEIPS